jgi:NAD(P)H-nitrite reductase large subunit
MKNYVIAGNGVATIGCIEGIKSVDKDSKITVISKENYPTYCRPLISYYLEGKTNTQKMKYRDDDFYSKNNVTVIYKKEVTKIDKDNKIILLSDDEKIPYDELCVATGSSPFVPPFENLDSVKNKYTFLTLDDALKIEKAVNNDSKVLIVGAGLIGLKCAEGLKDRVKSITVCDLADRVLSSILDVEAADMVQKELEGNGISFMLSNSATKFEKNIAYMKNGEEVEFDVLILAVGVRANISLIKDIGGEVGRGIKVNEQMQTSISHIYSAGDCTESLDISSGDFKPMALMPSAYMEGFCAGKNMAGEESKITDEIPMNSIGFFGYHIMTAGSYPSEESGGKVIESKSEKSLKKLFLKDDKLVGFIILGDVAQTGIYTKLIREQISLKDVDFERLKNKPDLYSFGEEYRRKILGSVV